MTAERIPIWLCDKKLWINDADRRTTCADVVATLTGRGGGDYAVAVDSGGGGHSTAATTMLADPGARLLKIWHGLRPDQKLRLQRANGGGDGADGDGACDRDDCASEMSGYRAHRKRRRDVVKHASRTVHPRRLSNTQAAEELLKLILEQSDTIRAQIKRLQDRDRKIEKIETETHKTRADALGSNYLLDAYLGGGGGGDDKEEKDSGITEGASVENEDGGERGETEDAGAASPSSSSSDASSSSAQEAIAYLERVVRINKKLYEHEERLIRLYVNVERCRDQDQLLDELRRAEVELANAERAYRENSALIRDADAELRARVGYVEQLQYEAAIVDSENELLAGFIEQHLSDRGGVRPQQQQNVRPEHQHHRRPENQQQQNRNAAPANTYRVLDTLV